jgi:hypothetical protein
MTRAKRSTRSSTRSDRHGCLRDVGCVAAFVFGLLGFLLLTTVPQTLSRWFHRDGYRPVNAEVMPQPQYASKSLTVVLETGERLSVRDDGFESPPRPGKRRVLYNPAARSLIDQRVIAEDHLPSTRDAFIPAGLMALFFALAVFSWFGPGPPSHWSIRASRKRPSRDRSPNP